MSLPIIPSKNLYLSSLEKWPVEV